VTEEMAAHAAARNRTVIADIAGPGVVGVIEQAVPEAVGLARVGQSDHARDEARHRLHHHHRRQLAP
jgi:hypothetical protein